MILVFESNQINEIWIVHSWFLSKNFSAIRYLNLKLNCACEAVGAC